MRKFGLAVSAILALVVAVLQPAAPALSVDTVNKSFTVTKSDGTPYAGVSVALLGWDSDLQENIQSAVGATSAQGQATVSVSSTADYYGYGAQPPVNDYSHAVFVEFGVNMGMAEAFAIRMKPANLVVELKQTNGQTALPGSWVHFPATGDVGDSGSARPVIRSGPIPIDVSTALSSSEKYTVQAEPNALPNQFWADYKLKVDNSNAISLYSDSAATQALTPRVVGSTSIYDLRFSSANLHGKLVTSTGQTQALPAGVSARVSFYKADSAGALDPQASASAEAPVLASGLYDAKLTNPTAGKYFAVFAVNGSLSIPSFTSEPLYVNSNGEYSAASTGPFVSSAAFVFESVVPTGASVNLKLQVTIPGTTTAEPSYLSVLKDYDSGAQLYLGAGRAANGKSSLSLADGIYHLWLDMVSPERTGRDYTVVVDQGEATLTPRNGSAITPDANGVFQISGSVPNLKIRVANPDDLTQTLRQVSVDVFNPNVQGDNFVAGTWAQNGWAYLSLPTGTFQLRVNPQAGGYAVKTYNVTVTANSTTITDAATQAAISPETDGSFSLAANKPNITGRLLDSAGAIVTRQGNSYVDVQLQKWNAANNNWDWVENGNGPVLNDGTFGLRTETTGTFRLNIRTGGRLDVANTVSAQFVVNDINQTSARGDINMPQPVLKVRVNQSGRSAYLNSAQININDHQNYDDWVDTGSIGATGISFPAAGTYYLTVNPPGGLSSAIAANRTYVAVVTGNPGALTATINGVNANGGYYDLALGVPNVTGKIVAGDGSAISRTNGVWINIQAQKFLANENRWDWTNYWTQIASDGSFGMSLQDNGTYRLRVEPNGIDGAAITRTAQFEVTDANRDGIAKAYGDIRLAAPSAKFKVRIPGSSADIKYAGIEVRKGDQWYDWINTNQNGIANFSALEAGNYSFVVHPNGDSSVSGIQKSYSATITETSANSGVFTVAVAGVSSDSNGFTVLNLGVPNVTGKLVDQAGAAVGQQNKTWVNIQVQKYEPSGDFWNWTNNVTNVRSDGTFGLNVADPGRYRLVINPQGRTDIARTISTEFTVTSANASTFTKAFGSIVMNGPSISGTVSSPDGSTKQPNSQVIAVDATTGQEMWEYSAQTDSDGKWSMMLPKGSYSVYARAPWGNQNFGSGDPVTGVTVAANGSATLASGNANAMDLRLANPTWSGTTVAPSTSNPLPFTTVCLFQDNGGKPMNQCTESDAQGKWALSKPVGFTGFNDTSQLYVRENRSALYAEARYSGKADVEAKLGAYVAGQTYANKSISPLAPNATLTVTAGGVLAPNLWVSIERDNVGWLASGMTDSQGVVRINIPNIALGFKIRAQVDSNRELAATYTTTTKSVSANDVTSHTANGIYSDTVAMAVPNFSAIVMSPGSNAAPVPNAWVDAFNTTTNVWSGGNSSLANGNVSLKLDLPSAGLTYHYQVSVNSPWNNPDMLASRRYFVDVDSAGAMVVHADTDTGTLVPAPTGSARWALSLKAPSVTGTVTLPDSSLVRDSYVSVLKNMQGWQQWMDGAQSRVNGGFGLALADGSYELFANVPYNQSGYAKSSRCAIDISGGVLATGNSSCVANGQVKLTLREPNLKFKMVHANQPVANANVNIQIGNWNTWAQAGRDGTIALFIDDAEILAKNPNQANGQTLPVWIYVDPPYGNNDIVRWNCAAGDSKPLCSELHPYVVGTPYLTGLAPTVLHDVEFAVPNTRLSVKLGDQAATSAGSGGWVTLFVEENGWKRWIAASNTNADGEAVFNVDDSYKNNSATRYSVEVNPPYQVRDTWSMKTYTGLTWADVNGHNFALGSPNLKLTMKQAQSADASAYGWVGVEEVNSSLNAINWLGGYGVDQQGKISLTLPDSKKIRLTLNPGPGSTGARTSCIFNVSAQGVVTKSTTAAECPTARSTDVVDVTTKAIQLELSPGNLSGTVTKADGGAMAGAIVFAQAYSGSTIVDGKTEQAVTKVDGRYGLQLDPAYNWKLKVFYVNPDGASVNYDSILNEWTVLGSVLGSAQTKDFVLPVRI